MKIAHVCPLYYPDVGGVETVVKALSERMVKLGHEVDVITTDPRGIYESEQKINGVRVIRVKSYAPDDSYYIAPGVTKVLRANKYDIIHTHNYQAFSSLFAMLGKSNSKFIFSPYYHGKGATKLRNNFHKLYKFMGNYIFESADKVICISDYEGRLVESKFNCKDKLTIIKNGINMEDFKGCFRVPNRSTILYIGRLEEYKGIQFIIMALSKLPDYKLTIIGKGVYCNELRAIADVYGVSNRIIWHEYLSRNELINEYAHAGVFINLSDQESFGINVAEALYIGVPSIVCTQSALSDFADDRNCFGVENRENIDEVVKAIRQAVEVRKVVLEYKIYNYDEVTEKILEAYK